MSSLIENINAVREKLDVIVAANSIFDEGVVPILTEIAALDLDQAVLDLKKGTFLGNRKLDIDLALNKIGIESTNAVVDNLAVWNTTATTVYYSYATVTFVDGVSITVNFVNDDLQPIVISNHGSLVAQLLTNVAFTTKLTNTGIFDDVGGATGNLLRVYDIVGASSNIERIQLNAVGGTYKVQNPIYYWGLTTSSFQTLAMRASDIIKLGNDIDSIILLATRIDEMLALQAQLPALVTNIDSLYANIAKLVILHTNIAAVANIHTNMTALLNVNSNMANITDVVTTIIPNIAEILLADTKAATATAKALEAFNSAAAAALSATTATTQAGIATAKANSILGLTTQTSTGAAGSLATVSYNPVDGKMTFSIPQGIKGDRGDAFTVNSVGLAADRSLYDAQIKGFSFLAIDVGMVYFKLSATSADWSIGSPFGKGDKGDVGLTGVGIDHVSFFSTTDVSGFAGHAGATDTYRITNTDATTYDFIVYNGLNGVLIDDVTLSLIATWSNQKISDELAQKANQASTYTKTEIDTALGLKFDKLGGSLGGALNEARATVISHATTADIWGALGNQIDFTGTATVTAFPNAPQAGATRELICAGACSFTAGANMLIDGVLSGSTVTCAANDTVIVRAISTTQFKLTRVVSKDQFKTVNGVSIVGSGDITIGVFDTGDIATSSDYTKYPSPQWLECNGSNYDKAVYPALHAVTGYAGSTSAETGREVATCQTVLDRFSNYYKAAITAFFEYGNGVVFSKDESVAAVYVNATTVKIFRLDVPTNKYVLVTTFTTAAQCMSMDISNSGNWIAFTAGNNGYLLKWNGTTYAYATNSSVSVAAYQHHSCAISDSEAFVYYGCVTSVFGKIYPISTNGLETACTGTSIPSHSYKNPIWLPNEDKIVIVTTSIQMYGVSGTVATLIGTAITSISTGIGGTDFSSDRKYLIARKTVSPYTEIYKIATAGLSLIHSDVTANVSALMYFDENRAIRIVGDTLTTQIVYTINTSTDAVTSSAAAFDSPFFSSYDGNTNKWDFAWGVVRVKSLSTAGYIIAGTVFSEATFKWDSGTSKYKAYSARLATAWDISYNTTGQYGIVSNNNGAAFLVSIDQTTFEPIAGSLKSIQYPSILNSSTVSNNYFTSCPTMFVCIQYGNPNVYSLDLATGVFTIVDVSVLSISASTTGYSIIQISPTGEFIANLRSNDNTWMYGAYKAANGSYVGTTPLSNGTTAIGTLGQWTANNKLLIDDAATTGFKVVQFTSLSATTNFVTPLGTYYHFTDSAGRIFYCDSLYDYYVKYLDGTTQLLIAHSSLQNIYVSPNGEFIQIATNGYMYDAVTGLYVSIGSCDLYGITSSLDFKQQLNRLFNKTLGCIMNGVSSYKTTFTNKVPLITPTATNMEKISKAFIKTGVA